MANNANNTGMSRANDAAALGKVFDTLKAKYQHHGITFGESVRDMTKNQKADVVNNIANLFFSNDYTKANGESGFASNSAINSGFRKNFIGSLESEYKARGANVISARGESFAAQVDGPASQMFQIYGSHLPNTTQLLLMALAPGVIKPIYNKLIKSVVTKGLDYQRAAVEPEVVTEDGKVYKFYDLLNSKTDLLKLNDGGQPLLTVDVEIEQKSVKAGFNNLCDLYNKNNQIKNPGSFKAIKSIYDFIQRGLKITHVKIKDKWHAATYVSTGNATQSGQLSDTIATIDMRVQTEVESNNKPIAILGTVKANGNILITTDSDELKALRFEFVVPSHGAQNPLKVRDRQTVVKSYIQKKAAMSTTLNSTLIEDVQLVLNKDIIARFTETSIQGTNATKDQYLLDYLDNQAKTLAREELLTKSETYRNLESYTETKNIFDHRTVDATIADYGMTDFWTGTNMLLTMGIADSATRLVEKLNPEVKEFSMFSSIGAAKWLDDPSMKNSHTFNIIGDATDESTTVGGISTPYTLKQVRIGSLYNASFIVSNRIQSQSVNRDMIDVGGVKRSGKSLNHRYTLLTRFEEHLDSYLFLHGLEKVTEGVNDVDYDRDKTLQYETRYDIVSYNKSMAVVDLIEKPTNHSATVNI